MFFSVLFCANEGRKKDLQRYASFCRKEHFVLKRWNISFCGLYMAIVVRGIAFRLLQSQRLRELVGY